MFRKIFYPFNAVFFILLMIAVTVLMCLDLLVFSTLLALCYSFKLHKAVTIIAGHISDSLEAANDAIIGISGLSEEVLSKKQNKEKSNT
jgi:hypothetical protein